MKKFLFIIFFSLAAYSSFANHTKGGWLYYDYLGPGASPNSVKYHITLKFYTECILNTGQFDPTISFSIFDGGSHALYSNVQVGYTTSNNIENCTTEACHPCISNIPYICYKITTYEFDQELPKTPNGFIISYQRCCRISGIINVQSPSNNVGETWTVTIPGTTIPGAEINSSPRFSQNDTAIICSGNAFTFDFSAVDPDNDQLFYSFDNAYTGGGTGNPTPNPATNPPYSSIPYSGGFSGTQPLGAGVTINPITGIVSGIAPGVGTYVITAVVSEYRQGVKIAELRKSLHIRVEDCSLTSAILKPDYTTCDGFTVNFSNQGSSPNIQTYYWDFGDGDTSTAPAPPHTYADTGVYHYKLVVNRGLACSDSATSIVRVYPGFHPGFTVAGSCKNTAIQFTDTTTADYGIVNGWNWNFADIGSPTNISLIKNPTHNYATANIYNVRFIVSSNKGCIDTVYKDVTILDQPPLSVTHDTLICVIDTLQLNAVGTGTFLWSPNYNINSLVIANPLVSPDVTTTYRVQLTDPFGCIGRDSVKVSVVNGVTQFAPNDTTICRTDSIRLNLVSDALKFVWTPNTTINNTTIIVPTVAPLTTTTYHVVGSIGKCTAQNDITVKVVPYPVANAGLDDLICFGKNTQLHASGGSKYSWSPATFLSASNIPNPLVIAPTSSVRYIVTVRDTLGCPKPVNDTVIVTVAKIKADAGPRDTSVVLGQPLQLNATGSTNYLWTPGTWLNDPTIFNPIALPQDNIEYVVRVSNSIGCFDTDTILVKVYKVKPDLYVPSSFSPNGDGLNDIFRPIAIGMRSVDLFQVYNRWGQLLYSGSGNKIGWDGTFGGKAQDPATYVWQAQGVDYLGNTLKRKGYVVLIR